MTNKIEKLIENLKFNYVNPNIMESNYLDDNRQGEVKLFKMDKDFTKKEAEKQLEEQGYMSATIRELLIWAKNWNGKDYIVTLDSEILVDGLPRVVYLWGGGGSRVLYLGWAGRRWSSSVLVAGVRKSSSKKLNPLKCPCGCICMKCQVFLDCCCGKKHTDMELKETTHGKGACGPFQSKLPQNDTINPLKRTVQEKLEKMQLKDLSDKVNELTTKYNDDLNKRKNK